MTTKHFIIGTAGHVDHGKSTLVKALTGTDPDRLPEEKKRQITIDLGFAVLNLTAPNGDNIQAGIVDVPGHEDFVRNMIAGIGSIDLALFVVAADDGWMPQSEEHLQILNYLGVQRAVIALTKSDLGQTEIVTNQIRERLSGTLFADSLIVSTSVRTRTGIQNLVNALASELAKTEPQRDIYKPRLFVDRVFTLHGIGTVATGTLTGGPLRRGQQIVVYPANLETRIRSIQSHGHELEVAQSGMRTAINLSDLGVDQIKRGDVVTLPSCGAPSSTLIVLIKKMSRIYDEKIVTHSLKNGSSIYVHHGTSRIAGRIRFRENGSLAAGGEKVAHLQLASPIFAFSGDHFVLRDSSEQNTIAGGTVLDPDADPSNFRSAAHIELLRERVTAPRDVDVCVRSQLKRDAFAECKTLLVKSNFGADEIRKALSRLGQHGEVVLADDIVADASYWHDLINSAARIIDRAHQQSPERRGVDLSELRAELETISDKLFGAVISELTRNGFARSENQIGRVSHRPSLPLELVSAAENIRAALSAKRFGPPDRKTFSQDRYVQQALRFLIDQGEIVEISSEIVVLRESAEQMQNAITELLSKRGSATASQVRQKIGTTRRVIIPFLEYLDRIGVTRRIGDERVLAKKSAAAKLANAARAQQT